MPPRGTSCLGAAASCATAPDRRFLLGSAHNSERSTVTKPVTNRTCQSVWVCELARRKQPAHGRRVLALLSMDNQDYKVAGRADAWVFARWDARQKRWRIVDSAGGGPEYVGWWCEIPKAPKGVVIVPLAESWETLTHGGVAANVRSTASGPSTGTRRRHQPHCGFRCRVSRTVWPGIASVPPHAFVIAAHAES